MRYLILIMLLTGCVKPANYRPSQHLSQQDRDEAACNIEASKYTNSYFPGNPILNAQGRGETFDLCMKSKGYSAQ